MTLVGLLIFLQMCSWLYMFFGMVVSRDRQGLINRRNTGENS